MNCPRGISSFLSSSLRWAEPTELASRTWSSASVVHSPPWYGLDVPLRRLEDRGLVEIDVEMASPVPPGSSAPVADDYFVAVTHEGRRAVEAGLQ
jgi:hypothetical protein